MSPENLAVIKGIIDIVNALGTWPNWGIVLLLAAIFFLGPLSAVVYLWRKDIAALSALQEAHRKTTAKQMDHYREDTGKILNQLGDYMKETRRMYEDNAALVVAREQDFKALCQVVEDQQGISISVTKAITQLTESIRTNQFCPATRVEKQKVEVAR